MSLLRNSNVRSCVPSESEIIKHEFVESVVTDEKRIISNAEGKKVGEEIRKVVSYRKPNFEELENRGIDYRLFTIDNQINAGVVMQPLPAFGSPSLEEKSQMSDYIEKVFELETNNPNNE